MSQEQHQFYLEMIVASSPSHFHAVHYQVLIQTSVDKRMVFSLEIRYRRSRFYSIPMYDFHHKSQQLYHWDGDLYHSL